MSPGAVLEPEPVPEKEEWREKLDIILHCKDCRIVPPSLYEDHASGDLICADCGLVLQARSIDEGSEWRTFANDDQGNDDPSRVGDGPNALLNGAQLDTTIAYGDGSRSKELARAQNRATLDKGNKALVAAYKLIDTFCMSMELPTKVIQTCKNLFKDAEESRSFKGKSQDALISSCIFIACRRNAISRTFREIVEVTNVSKKEIGRTFKLVERFLLEQDKQKKGRTVVLADGRVAEEEEYKTGTNPTELCPRYISDLGLPHRILNVALAIVANMQRIGALAGRSPLSATAACIFMACHLTNIPKSAKEIGEVARVSDSTIRGAYKLLWLQRDKVITDEMKDEFKIDASKLPDPRSADEKAQDSQKEANGDKENSQKENNAPN